MLCWQEHEQALIDAIARVADASDGGSGEYIGTICLIIILLLFPKAFFFYPLLLLLDVFIYVPMLL